MTRSRKHDGLGRCARNADEAQLLNVRWLLLVPFAKQFDVGGVREVDHLCSQGMRFTPTDMICGTYLYRCDIARFPATSGPRASAP